jgi:hypothetical protein
MYSSNQGHGIAGAKGIYSSKVKLANWVEDSFGEILAQQGRESDSKNYMTNTMACYKAPQDQPEPARLPTKMPTVAELKIKNKEGMPYSLLFPHGMSEFPAEERFKTNTMSFTIDNNQGYALPEGSLLRQKSKSILQDSNLAYKQSTLQRCANAHLKYKVPDAPRIAINGPIGDLPNWSRNSALTSTFPK